MFIRKALQLRIFEYIDVAKLKGKEIIEDVICDYENSPKDYDYAYNEFSRTVDDGHVIVDVRRSDEYAKGHIPGAILIPNESITDIPPEELPDKNQTILVYCRTGRRSKEASQKLADMGYVNVYEFGGIEDWTGDVE